jgi:FkbM family methyltransferase
MTSYAEHIVDTALAERTVALGRRLAAARWPTRLETFRSGSKKVAWTAFEARLVRTPIRYAFRELLRPQVADYSLRHVNGRISLRHQSGDIDVFRKFYAYGYYEWPTEVTSHLDQLSRAVNVLDLGANIGFFEVHAGSRFPIGGVVGFEPDPSNAEMLDRVYTANGDNWQIIRACASNRDGFAMFKSGQQNFSRIEHDGDTSVPTVDVFPYVAEADLVKMNIEGSEWEILQDPRLTSTSAVWIVEYHRVRNPDSDITSLARDLFDRCGYTTRVVNINEGNGLLWAWRDAPI